MKMCKNNLQVFQFILQIIFGSIFNIYHATPNLCCPITDLGIFGTVLGIFGVASVTALTVVIALINIDKERNCASRKF